MRFAAMSFADRPPAPRSFAAPVLLALLLAMASAAAQDVTDSSELEPIVAYRPAFFERYQPNTALEMVQQLPGFQLDDGDDRRGFGGSAGNVLVNDRYVSTKQDKPSQLLARIPASQVARIELIRSQVRDIDLQGRAVVANVIIADEGGVAASWEIALRKNFSMSPLAPTGAVSVQSRWRDIDFNVGVDARRGAYGDPGFENLYDGAGNLLIDGREEHEGSGYDANVYLNAGFTAGSTRWKVNSTIGQILRHEELVMTLTPQTPAGPPYQERFDTRRDERKIELGVDAERPLGEAWIGKGIVIYNRLQKLPYKAQTSFDTDGEQVLYRRADTDSVATEMIGRLEFDWSPSARHVWQFNIEAANNELDAELLQVVDSGDGIEIVPVPGANTVVEESRADLLISDTWTRDNLEIEIGLGAENSTISQSGDAQNERRFTFVKPRFVFTHYGSDSRQLRVRVAREVAQLDFEDFVSATDFEDDDLALGNPDLQPETTWIAEVGHEWRFTELAVLKMTAFHHWVSDVQDLLPLDLSFEVPGNIGDGRRWGVEVEATIPMDRIGLRAARLDVKGRLQDSTVTDPVTGEPRVLSAKGGHAGPITFQDDNRYALMLGFRQDFDAAQLAWGWNLETRGERPLFKVNELDLYDETHNFDVFVETTRWLGLKIRLTGLNLLDIVEHRDRTLYSGGRGISPVDYVVDQELTNGRRILLTVSGTF